MSRVARWPAALALGGSLLGLVFGALSTLDYVKHLDRQVHGIHCSIVPGAALEEAADSGCRIAMYSPYSALLRDRIWGGVPIALLAVGAFAFFVALSLYLLMAGDKAPRRAVHFLALTGLTPLVASGVMATISAVKLGEFCQTCIGIYVASLLLAIASLAGYFDDKKHAREALRPKPPEAGSNVPPTVVDEAPEPVARPLGSSSLTGVWLLGLGVFTMVPAGVYLRSVPSYNKYVGDCGDLQSTDDPKKALLKISSPRAEQPVYMLVDPLCPTCKGFHQRLVSEGYFDKLDTTLILFPLDSECNWNLSTPLHPGACVVSKAVLCGEGRELSVLEWAYEQQEQLLARAKSKDGEAGVLAMVEQRWPGVKACIEDTKTGQRLDEMMRFAVRNQLPVSTPQLFVGTKKLCDEDVDIGLSYALGRLAPKLAKN